MTVPDVKALLLWSTGLNYALLLIWFGLFSLAHDWLFRLHRRWFGLSAETFDALSYGGIAFYKIVIFVFNLIPLLALKIVFR